MNRVAKIGTNKQPAIIRVKTLAKAEEIMSIAQDHGWKVIIGVEPDKPEDLRDWERLTNRQMSTSKGSSPHDEITTKVGRNEPCPCGSGKKYKKCCGQRG